MKNKDTGRKCSEANAAKTSARHSVSKARVVPARKMIPLMAARGRFPLRNTSAQAENLKWPSHKGDEDGAVISQRQQLS